MFKKNLIISFSLIALGFVTYLFIPSQFIEDIGFSISNIFLVIGIVYLIITIVRRIRSKT